VGGMPLQLDFKAGSWPEVSRGNFTALFDRDAYLSQLKNKLAFKIDPKTVLASVPDPLAAVKKKAEHALQRELSLLNTQYQDLLGDKIYELGNLQNLFFQDLTKLRNDFANQESLHSLSEKQHLLQQFQAKLNVGENVDTAEFNALNRAIFQAEGVKKFVETIEAHKKSWLATGLLAKIKQWEVLKVAKFNQVMNDPSLVTTLVKQQLNLNGVQRFFLKINKLKLGQNSLSSSPFSVQNFLNNGAVSEFLNKGKSAMLFMGKSMEGSSILDIPFSHSQLSTSMGRGVQLGKQSNTSAMNFTAMSFDQGLNTIGNLAGFANFKRSIVTGFRKEFALGQHGSVNAEISRSVSTYNTKSAGNEQGNALLKLISAEDFASNTAFFISYRDEIPNLGLRYQVHVKRAAIGYNNPGNPYLNTGSREAGFSVRKNFFKNKLLISLRNDLKEFNYSQQENNKWRNLYAVFDVKWKLRKGQFLSLRYLPNRMFRFDSTGKHTTTLFDQMSFDGNLTKRIRRVTYTQYFNLSYQRNQYVLQHQLTGNTSLGFIANQTISFRKLLVYWNTQYNRSANSSQLVYFNSNFNTEVGTNFTFFQKLNTTTSISYNTIQQWYQQIGVRQNVSLRLGQQFDLHLFVDARKNLKLYQPLIFGLVRGEVGVHYLFK
jgi:hypothetical protein